MEDDYWLVNSGDAPEVVSLLKTIWLERCHRTSKFHYLSYLVKKYRSLNWVLHCAKHEGKVENTSLGPMFYAFLECSQMSGVKTFLFCLFVFVCVCLLFCFLRISGIRHA